MNIMSLFKFSLSCYDCGLFIKEIAAKRKYCKWVKLAKKNEELKKYKTADVCYICGNGPSLKKVNLDELQGDTIVMNDHWRVAPNFKMKPTFYMINDNAYALPKLHERLKGVIECFPDIPHLMAVNIGHAIDEGFENNNTNIYYYNPIGRTFKSTYDIDFTKCTYYSWNIVSAAIQLALYLGYKEIRLLGCDYSLFASRFITHMYDKDGQKVPCPFKLRDMLYKYTFTTHIHYELAKYAEKKGVKIINMTSETLLDAYEIDENSNY